MGTIHMLHSRVPVKVINYEEVNKVKIKAVLKKSSFFIIIISGMLTGSLVYASFSFMLNQENVSVPDYPKNEFGETYGSALDAKGPEQEPDLIKAIGVDGAHGYVRAAELNGEEPKTPEEALAQQAKATVREINLYESDGKTIIGKFIITPGEIEMRDKNGKIIKPSN